MAAPPPPPDALDLQLVDIEALQVKAALDAGPPWIKQLRANALALDDLAEGHVALPPRTADVDACYLVRLWCRSARGESVCVAVCDPLRHFYLRLRSELSPPLLDSLQQLLHERSQGTARCERVLRYTTAGWHCDPQDNRRPLPLPWLKLSVASAWQLRKVSCGKGGWLAEALGLPLYSRLSAQRTAHRDLDLRTELLEAIGVRAGGWLRLPPELARRLRRGAAGCALPGLRCGAALQVRTAELAGTALELVAMAPLRVLSFDIECISEDDAFPLAKLEGDAVICVGLYSKALGAPAATADCTMLCLRDVDRAPFDEDPDPAARRTVVKSFDDEAALLLAFAAELQASDADVVVGYNTCTFDWRYLRDRVELLLRLQPRARAQAGRLSRYAELSTEPKEQQLASSAMGDNPLCYPQMPGRVNFDLWLYLKRENVSGLENLKLNTVSKHFLKDEKHDLGAKAMFRAFREGPRGRGQVAAYCRQDCKLVLDLLEKTEALPSVWEMAKITCTAPEDILFRGQQLKVYTQLVLQAGEAGYLVEDPPDAGGGPQQEDEGYQGATVVEPTPGYYLEPIFCLDFASLYPSLMRTYNLSPDTLVRADASELARSTPANEIAVREGLAHRFVKGSLHVGLLPRILAQLLGERKRVKKLMEAEQDPQRRALLNSKQLALKISANSVYGACGATHGRLSCRECAEATTAAGREAIAFTCDFVRSRPGFAIVYGDTDSAFMRIPEQRRGDAAAALFEMGEALAEEVTGAIAATMPGEQNHIKLEFEKILHPLILYKKKRYAGLCVEDPRKPPKLLAKGLELVRKDACRLVKKAQTAVIEALLKARDAQLAKSIMLEALEGVLRVPAGGPFDELKQSKSLRSAYKDESSQVHCVVRELMRQREVGSEPRIGDRVEFVVVASRAGRVVDKAEDVAHAERAGLPPDWLHYLEAVERPLTAILEVPLRAVDPAALAELQERCLQLKDLARRQVAQHCMARHGTKWSHGWACKDGTVQRSLRAVLDAAAPAAAPAPAPAATAAPAPAAAPAEVPVAAPAEVPVAAPAAAPAPAPAAAMAALGDGARAPVLAPSARPAPPRSLAPAGKRQRKDEVQKRQPALASFLAGVSSAAGQG